MMLMIIMLMMIMLMTIMLMMMVKNFECPVLRTSFSEAGPGFVARYKHLD